MLPMIKIKTKKKINNFYKLKIYIIKYEYFGILN